MEIVKAYKEQFPQVKLVGRRYTNRDRDERGTFARYWEQAFRERIFETLARCKGIPGVSEDYVGAMRCNGGAEAFEYWIGVFLAPDAEAPEGFEAVEIPAGAVGVCWLLGNGENGELYGAQAEELAKKAMAEQGWKCSGWLFERYNYPRFVTPDAQGNVILDICAYLE